MTLKSHPNFEEKLTFSLKNDMRNLVNFNASWSKSENLHLDGSLLLKVCNVWAKKLQSSVVKNDLWFQKWHKEFREFSHKSLKLMLDKSSVCNVLVEGMQFLDKSSLPNFNFLDFPLLVWSFQCLSKFLMWFWKPGVSFRISFAPFCNILAKT